MTQEVQLNEIARSLDATVFTTALYLELVG